MTLNFANINDLKKYVETLTVPIKNMPTTADGIQEQFDQQALSEIITVRYMQIDGGSMKLSEAHFYSDGESATTPRWE